MVQADIEVEYSIDRDDVEIQKRLFILGNLIAQEIRSLALRMDLKDKGNYAQGFIVSIEGDRIIIENRVGYAKFLEFGTFEYWKRFGLDKFPSKPDPKKKDMTLKERESFPKGMQPFAPMRRVLRNRAIMQRLIREAFEAEI